MGIFNFLKKKNDLSDTVALEVEPLPLQFEVSDFIVNKVVVEDEAEIVKQDGISLEIIAAITAAIQVILQDEQIRYSKQPLLRRKHQGSWKIAGIQRVMQVRQ